MYICAWQAPELPPEALISSRMTLAAVSPRPAPPYSSGIRAASQPLLGQRGDELLGIAVGLEPAPVRRESARTARAPPRGSRRVPRRSRHSSLGCQLGDQLIELGHLGAQARQVDDDALLRGAREHHDGLLVERGGSPHGAARRAGRRCSRRDPPRRAARSRPRGRRRPDGPTRRRCRSPPRRGDGRPERMPGATWLGPSRACANRCACPRSPRSAACRASARCPRSDGRDRCGGCADARPRCPRRAGVHARSSSSQVSARLHQEGPVYNPRGVID